MVQSAPHVGTQQRHGSLLRIGLRCGSPFPI
jgi:hypothetical protein